MNGIKIDLSDFARVLYPGILAWLFISWRYPQSFDGKWEVPMIILLSLAIGTMLYSIYRAVVLYPAIRWIEDKKVHVPQFEFYRRIARELRASERIIRSMENATACAVHVLTTEATPEFRAQLYRFNSFVHVPLLTSFVASCVFLHDLVWSISRWISHSLIPPCFNGFTAWWLVIWLAICAAFLWIGIAFDHWQSDQREAAFLRQYRPEYEIFIHGLMDAEEDVEG